MIPCKAAGCEAAFLSSELLGVLASEPQELKKGLFTQLNVREFVLSKGRYERKKAVFEVRYDSFWASGVTFKDK